MLEVHRNYIQSNSLREGKTVRIYSHLSHNREDDEEEQSEDEEGADVRCSRKQYLLRDVPTHTLTLTRTTFWQSIQ